MRPVSTDEELRSFLECDAMGFSTEVAEEEIPLAKDFLELDRTMGVFEEGQVVGTSANLTMEVTVPGPFLLPCAGVTYVAVLPSHRRRGILTEMMCRLLNDAEAHEEPAAALLASESAIYGRFGFGPATFAATYSLSTAHARLVRPVRTPGTIRVLSPGQALGVLPAVHDDARRRHAGGCSRSPGWWNDHLADLASRRQGASRLFHAVHQPGGDALADGYVTWRVEPRWHPNPDHVALVLDVAAASSEVRLALLRFACELDLVGEVRFETQPVDEPFRWLLADPRRLVTTSTTDVLWLRLLDVPRCLTARAYGSADRLVMEVDDRFRPAAGGRFALDTTGDAPSCGRTAEPADLGLSASVLAALYLGGVGARTLALAGAVRELSPEAVARASRLFLTDRPPYGDTEF